MSARFWRSSRCRPMTQPLSSASTWAAGHRAKMAARPRFFVFVVSMGPVYRKAAPQAMSIRGKSVIFKGQRAPTPLFSLIDNGARLLYDLEKARSLQHRALVR